MKALQHSMAQTPYKYKPAKVGGLKRRSRRIDGAREQEYLGITQLGDAPMIEAAAHYAAWVHCRSQHRKVSELPCDDCYFVALEHIQWLLEQGEWS